MSYPFQEIESRWQKYWLKNRTFRTPGISDKPKYYVLDMFPYPSGAGLHVGHPEGYTATDIIARYKRMKGYAVLHPMGWDAFGLPAERYAMQTGIHPSVTTEKNIANFRRQLQSLGFSYDWEREINTTDPSYYKWTQWIFLKLFESWYDEDQKKARPVSELPVPESLRQPGKEKELNDYIASKRLAYIAEMPVNWCPGLGTVLANEEVDEWVSKGYTVERRPMRQWMLRITAYAERLLEDLQYTDWPAGTLELQKNWIGRSEGAELDFNIKNSEVSVRVYTTRPDTLYGATYLVLAPEHPAVSEIVTEDQKSAVAEYIEKTKLKSERERQIEGEKTKTGVFTGAYAVHPLTGAEIPVWISDYVLMGYGTGAIMSVPAHDTRDFAFARQFGLPVVTVVSPEKNRVPEEAPAEAFTGEGYAVNSPLIDGLATAEAKKKMTEHLEKTGIGKKKTNYKLRDWLFSRQRYWGEPIPVSFDEDGNAVASVKEEDLPLLLPPSEEFQPAENGESPLARLKDWVYYTDDSGRKMRRETNTMPQWAGSSWYYLRFIDPHNEKAFVDPEKESYWMGETGVDLYVGGAEHAVLHLLYARFWHKVLYDLGYVSTKEPFKKLVHQGLILGEDGNKMSKSRGNVVNPDDVVAQYGADSFRLFEMFLGPLEQMKPWSSKGIEGVFRFLSKVYRLYTAPDSSGADPVLLEEPSPELEKKYTKLIHKTVKKVTEDTERMSFNTAISAMMIYVNEVQTHKRIGRQAAEDFLKILSPYAPHLAEELWSLLGHKESISHAPWPDFDPAKAANDETEIVFQVNGKIRAKVLMPADVSEEEMKKAALENDSVKAALEGKTVRKVIIVKGRLVNIAAG